MGLRPEPAFTPERIAALFGDMAATYGVVNLLSSFGFSHHWRRACVRELPAGDSLAVADLMCGGAEAAVLLSRTMGQGSRIDAYDLCESMCQIATSTVRRKKLRQVAVHHQNVFSIPESATFDRICCSFGLKTLSDVQLAEFAGLVRRCLRPGGVAAFVEIHVPRPSLLRFAYLFYLRRIIPLIGRIADRNSDCYRWLAVYTEDFAARDRFGSLLKSGGLEVRERALFFGCARLYVAVKPATRD
jgi:demethylmenaquinone methyltransferase/2-methoxy-6-polyprenyl-1,4-benzoquinol methylase